MRRHHPGGHASGSYDSSYPGYSGAPSYYAGTASPTQPQPGREGEGYPSSNIQYAPVPPHPSLTLNTIGESVASQSSMSSPVRRAAKACANCRRDKIRCDGGRPCSACTKKGYTPIECIDGCENCRRARVRCKGGRPCERCIEEGISCADDRSGSITPGAGSPSSPTFRGRGSSGMGQRAKLACQGCRRDNKKCEDKRPCSRCVSRAEECVHIERGPKLVKIRCENCRTNNKRCEDNRPCAFCVEHGHECIDISRKDRGLGSRVKSACTNCRNHKIRCDGARPCSHCERRGIECVDRPCKACVQTGVECHHRSTSPTLDQQTAELYGSPSTSTSSTSGGGIGEAGYYQHYPTHYHGGEYFDSPVSETPPAVSSVASSSRLPSTPDETLGYQQHQHRHYPMAAQSMQHHSMPQHNLDSAAPAPAQSEIYPGAQPSQAQSPPSGSSFYHNFYDLPLSQGEGSSQYPQQYPPNQYPPSQYPQDGSYHPSMYYGMPYDPHGRPG